MAKKISKSDVDFIEQQLLDYKIQLDNIKTYLNDKSWINIEKDSVRRTEFKFQSELFDKHIIWTEKYMNLIGIIDFYKEHNKEDDDKIRKGYNKNDFMEMLINEDLG